MSNCRSPTTHRCSVAYSSRLAIFVSTHQPGVVSAHYAMLSRRAEPSNPLYNETIRKRKYVMTELTISASEITEALRKHVTDFDPTVTAEQVGRVVEVGDGIARVSGLPSAKVNELLEFEDGTMGLAMNLDEETIGCVVLGSVDNIEEEQVVRSP